MTNNIDLINRKFSSTLKECSKDNSNNVYMTELTTQVINFDKVKESYAESLSLQKGIVNSVDAILKDQEKILFIEFKNGKIVERTHHDDDQTIYNIKYKVRDSLLIYNDIEKKNISDTRKDAIFILVYNEKKNPISQNSNDEGIKSIHTHIGSLGNTEIVRFKMEQFKNIYFKEVHTYTVEEFESYLQNINT